MYVPSTEGRPREASQGWGGTGTRGCGSQLHPRADPGATPSATTGPAWSGHRGTRKREKPVARWTGAFLFLRLLWRATPPHFGGREKETGKPQARPNLGPLKLGCFTILNPFFSVRPRGSGAQESNAVGKTGSPLARGRTVERGYDRDHRAASALPGKTPMPLLKFGVGQPV